MVDGGELVIKDVLVEPGYVNVPAKPSRLFTVTASGVAVTLYDKKRKLGGMNHYIFPYREPGGPSTARFACPAVVALVKMLLDSGSEIEDLEAQMYGGADNPEAMGFVEGQSKDNVRVGLEVLHKFKIKHIFQDTGGSRGRKVLFNTHTGETVVAKVDNVRSSDWYPGG